MAEKRISLVELCGGNTKAKEEFLEIISKLPIGNEYYELLHASWELGFQSCVDLIFNAMRQGTIGITVSNSDGDE